MKRSNISKANGLFIRIGKEAISDEELVKRLLNHFSSLRAIDVSSRSASSVILMHNHPSGEANLLLKILR